MKLMPNEDGLLDIVMDNGVVQERTILSAVMVSILANRRASQHDPLPYGFKADGTSLLDDRQGWVGDIFDERGRLVGSKLWLLAHEIATEETRNRAIQYVREAIQWTIDDGYVQNIEIQDEWHHRKRLNLAAELKMSNGDKLSLRVDYEKGTVYEL